MDDVHQRQFYDVSFVFANSPQAKGKIERVHRVWQDRLPSSFQREDPSHIFSIDDANAHIQALVDYRNRFELHREIAMSPKEAWNQAQKELRTKLRAIPDDGWWEFVWSDWSRITVGPRGRVTINNVDYPTDSKNGTKAWLCHHINGTYSVLLNEPSHETEPMTILLTTQTLENPCES